MIYYAPLFGFWSNADTITFTKYLSIQSDVKEKSKLSENYFLSKFDIDQIANCKFGALINTDNIPSNLTPSPILNTLLLSIWILSPNKTHIKYSIRIDNNLDTQLDLIRFLDEFQFNKFDSNKTHFVKDELALIKKYYNSLIRITRNNRRLHTALVSTFLGSTSYNWKTAFLLYTSALEAMLNFKKGGGITKLLSKSYACLTEVKKYKRDIVYKKFYKLYNVRSDIMHGRISNRRRGSRNLKELSELASLLRKLWQYVLVDKNKIEVLEKNDLCRESYYKSIEMGYSPPKI